MNTAKNMRHGIVKHNRHAISRKNRQDHGRIPSDKRIRLGHLLVNRERARPPVLGRDNAHSGAMHLASKHEIPEVSPNGRRHAPPVLQHSPRVIPDGEAQIQRLVGAYRSSAAPRSNERLDRQARKRGPTQEVDPGSRAGRGSGINGVSHRPRVYRRPGHSAA